ncbi:nuclear transport factor 2 family protein [Acidicapsa ligni]|uniref:nuclear transport factor 2 family protein n=1 Tax=Acidicapsa ligni TaxID=542300 RepID=UPI0021E0C175|nr:nuclear transport factor 2 family protein [Acidicapsa ligni]
MVAKSPFRIVLAAGFLLLMLGVVAVPLFAGPAQHPLPRAQRHEYRHEIEVLEEAWRTAMIKRNSTALEGLLADDYTGITANGAIQTKEQAVTSLRTGTIQLTDLTISDRKVRVYGLTAVVTSQVELTGTRDEKGISGKYRYTRVYVRNPQSQWKIVSFEASRIQDSERK